MGLEIGNSLLEEDRVSMADDLLKKSGDKIVLPVDVVLADDFKNDAKTQIVAREKMLPGWEGVDIGPKTVEKFGEIVRGAKTVIWNGPMGVFEMPNFAKGTNQLAEAVAKATTSGAITVIGGGDTASAVKQAGLGDKMSHISTGGGASLEFMEGKELPGVAALTDC